MKVIFEIFIAIFFINILPDEMPTEAIALQSLFPGQQVGATFGAQPPKLETVLCDAGLPPPPTIPTTVDAGN